MAEQIIRYLGIGIEDKYAVSPDEYGADIASEIHLDIASADLDTPDDSILTYDGGIGRSQRTIRPGAYIPSGSINYALDINTIAYLLYLVLGNGEQVDPDTTTNKYIFTSGQNIKLPGATFYLAKDLFIHKFLGTVINQLTITVDNEFAEASFDVIAQKDADGGAVVADLSTLDLPTEYPLAFHEVTFSLNDFGQAVAEKEVENITLTINNNTDNTGGVVLGSRYPKYMLAQNLEVTVSFDIAFENKDEIEDFWGQAGGPANKTPVEKVIEIDFDAGTDGKLNINLPKAFYNNINTQASGRDRLIQTIEVQTLLDVENNNPDIIATLENNNEYAWVEDNTTP